ncbi:MAG: flagellar hook-length control protein FliK [Sulfurimonas sp.]|uniref:flagellar hook-length control protein FliK n=1 Tax=Sulfurimonas sp. TaxID=2022749 RepID=UPI00262DA5D9|nr:flagellar hook-length control protein FliK [Sulfurimonas sp.]MDD5373521.1 flagellar hook-length control protein FliK [Sulfurimonas sp.]
MILLDMKSNKSISSPLNLTVSNDKTGLSFSDLLKGVKEGELIQNGSLLLSLGADEKVVKSVEPLLKTDNLSSLLTNEDKLLLNEVHELAEFSELNPKVTATLGLADMKTLIADAKNYLKEIIQNSDNYKNTEIKELPKTLSGLIEVAKKFGINISKISIEDVKISVNTDMQAVKNEVSTKTITDASDDIPIKVEFDAKDEVLPKKIVQNLKVNEKQTVSTTDNTKIAQEQVSNEIKNSDKVVEVQRELKETPLFKAQTVSEHTTTEQIVQTKANNSFKADKKTSKDKSDETLKLLLGDEKSSIGGASLAVDFSAAAKADTSVTAQGSTRTLEELLQGESSVAEQNQPTIKTEALATHKADSFEVKINEAKQMIRYLSDDVKNAIDEYKSPFTRVKVQLNPQHLGEVDLTVVQRGKNLHVNISSNNTAINALAMNVNELKVQLNNSGINNATLNFSNGSQNSDTNASAGQQQRQNEQKRAHEEYNYFENEEIGEEILSSLEIVVPRYI